MLRYLTLALVSLTVLGGWSQRSEASEGLKIVVILDNSGSMNTQLAGRNTRIAAAKEALLKVLQQLPAQAEVGVLLLNPGSQGRWQVPLGPLDIGATREAVNRVRADGYTPLGESMKMAANSLLELRGKQKYGTYKLLIITDGEATDAELVERYLPEIQSRGLLMDVIGVAMGSQHRLATRANTYRNVEDPESLEKAISAVVLGESSSDSRDDTGESDFELIAPLPAELAAASLAVLASPTTSRSACRALNTARGLTLGIHGIH